MIVMHCCVPMAVRPVAVESSQERIYLQPMHGQRGLLQTIYKGNGVAVCNGMLVIQILKWGGCHFTGKSSMSNGTVWICWQSLYAEISGFFTPSPPLMISNRQFYFHILKPSSGCYFTRTCRKHFAAALVGFYSQVISNIINSNMTWFFSPIKANDTN